MTVTSEFRFSPRPNRAHEIAWMAWGSDAFERARTEDKPILLAISAVWCHWCHVMDETSYSDPEVIDTINRRYVPIRVDNDRRPDVNARYNMGGWPTTAFLTPDGSPLTGATYLPPGPMRRALEEIAEFYAGHKAEIAERVVATSARSVSYRPALPGELDEEAVAGLVQHIAEGFDEEYAGFGDAPKFPQPEMLELLLSEWRLSGDERLHEMVARTMLAMSSGGMYDRVEGGFFRYSTTRDWSVPHFEKMTEDHAGLLRVLAALQLTAPSGELRATLVSAMRYVRTVLYDPATRFFAGSQDADEEYFALPLDARRAREAPYVDRTSYSNWTCALAGSLLLAARTLDDDALAELAAGTLDAVDARMLDGDGLVFHVLEPGKSPAIRGLLTDQSAYLRALVDAHEVTGEPRFLERAGALADRIVARFEAEDGGFYDRIEIEAPLGRLSFADRPIVENGIVAESLLRLASLTGRSSYRASAQRALLIFARTFASASSFAAAYGRALRRLLTGGPEVRIVGSPAQTADFRETAARLPNSLTTIRTLPPAGAAGFDLPSSPSPAAYVCAGTACGPPALEAAGLRAAYESVAVPPATKQAGPPAVSNDGGLP